MLLHYLAKSEIQYICVSKTIPPSFRIFFCQMAVFCNKILSKEYLFIIYLYVLCKLWGHSLCNCFCKTLRKVPFSLEDKHTIKVLREQKLYGATDWECFGIKTGCWVEFKLHRVRLTLPAASIVVRVAVGRTRLAVHDLVLSGSEPHRLCGVGNSTRACVQASTDHGRGRAANVLRRNGTIWTRKWLTTRSMNGAGDWQPALQPAEDILNIHSAHYCICSHSD